MPEYCITTKELWYSNLYINAENIDDAIHQAKAGEGDIDGTDYGDTIGYTSIRDTETDEETDLETPIITDDNDPNNIFTKSKKQEEVDKSINILKDKHITYSEVEKALKILRSIKNI